MLAPLTTVAICQLQVCSRAPALVRPKRTAGMVDKLKLGPPLLQALSPSGRCKSFDASGDGYGRGEGFITALLAQTQVGPPAMAVVRGSAVNQDGRSSGLTAPNGPSQTRLVLHALGQAGITPVFLSLVAVHGTGTPLGDPIEVGALGQAAGNGSGSTDAPLVLSSIKSCYGHTEGAAGLTGLLLAAHCAVQLCSSPVMHLRNSNAYVEAALRDWVRNSQLTAAIPRQQQAAMSAAQLAGTSSFGMSGVNAHVVMCAPQSLAEGMAAAASAAKQLRQSQRLWPMAPVHCLLYSCAQTSEHSRFSCLLSQPMLGYLWQHQPLGRSTLPATTTWEIMTAAASCLTNKAAGSSVCQATMAQSIECKPSMVISCAVHHPYGTLQLFINEMNGMLSATASVVAVAPALSDSCNHKKSPCAYWMSSLSQSMGYSGLYNSVAAASFDYQGHPGHGYCCHPTLTQSAATLAIKVDMVVGCELYLAACTQHNNTVSVEAGKATATLWTAEGTAATRVHGLLARPATTLLAERANVAFTSPLWNLTWHPTDISPEGKFSAKALLVSTAAWPLSALSSAHTAHELPMLAMNAVWGAGLPTCSCVLRCPEISLGSNLHLYTLFQSMEAKQCMYVQPPGAAVDVCAALATYRLVANAADVCISLVTYDQSLVNNATPCPDPTVAMLEGKVHAASQ